uniref:Putative secreted peptide n=1 Tax=Anopheles braziliensis TaxID=58242 RepID=A0A2M3ZY23_9DIPT
MRRSFRSDAAFVYWLVGNFLGRTCASMWMHFQGFVCTTINKMFLLSKTQTVHIVFIICCSSFRSRIPVR